VGILAFGNYLNVAKLTTKEYKEPNQFGARSI